MIVAKPAQRVYSQNRKAAHRDPLRWMDCAGRTATPVPTNWTDPMAYSLGDPYRPLRLIMRLNGVVVGGLLGLPLLLASPATLARLGIPLADATFAVRVAGVALLGAGLFLLGNSAVRDIDLPQLAPCLLFHALLALVLILGWFRGDLADLTPVGQVGLLVVFALCLVGALAPVRYFGAEYRF